MWDRARGLAARRWRRWCASRPVGSGVVCVGDGRARERALLRSLGKAATSDTRLTSSHAWKMMSGIWIAQEMYPQTNESMLVWKIKKSQADKRGRWSVEERVGRASSHQAGNGEYLTCPNRGRWVMRSEGDRKTAGGHNPSSVAHCDLSARPRRRLEAQNSQASMRSSCLEASLGMVCFNVSEASRSAQSPCCRESGIRCCYG